MTAHRDEEELLTVGQVAGRFGITVRALHHYDRIGLVVPSERSYSGYRLYAPADVERLARVVVLRRLELPLEGIAEALDGDLTAQLSSQREAVMARMEELSGLLRAIDTALEIETAQEAGMNEYKISTAEMKELFGEGFDESYEAEADERWGGTEAYAESRRRAKSYDKEQWAAIKAESDEVIHGFAAAKRTGAPADSQQALDAVGAHRGHIEKWFNPVPLPMLRGMGEMYSADPRFAATYDSVEPGLAQYVTQAVLAYCDAEERNGA